MEVTHGAESGLAQPREDVTGDVTELDPVLVDSVSNQTNVCKKPVLILHGQLRTQSTTALSLAWLLSFVSPQKVLAMNALARHSFPAWVDFSGFTLPPSTYRNFQGLRENQKLVERVCSGS